MSMILLCVNASCKIICKVEFYNLYKYMPKARTCVSKEKILKCTVASWFWILQSRLWVEAWWGRHMLKGTFFHMILPCFMLHNEQGICELWKNKEKMKKNCFLVWYLDWFLDFWFRVVDCMLFLMLSNEGRDRAPWALSMVVSRACWTLTTGAWDWGWWEGTDFLFA